jgi:hypothetical protein
MKTTGVITPNLLMINDSHLGSRHMLLAGSANTSGRSPSSQSRKSGLNDDQLLAFLDEALTLGDVSLAIMDTISVALGSIGGEDRRSKCSGQ